MVRTLLRGLKKKLLDLINYPLAWFFLNKYKERILIYDIDNTLTDTATILKKNKRLSNSLFSELVVFPNMKKRITEEYVSRNKIVYFTVRPFLSWMTTLNWLRQNFIRVKWNELFIFSTPEHKVEFIFYLHKKGFRIFFADDLSYNHENGEPLFFEKEIAKLKNIDITYISYTEIMKINQEKNN